MKESFDKWCDQLLDTGKRNKLINYKDSRLRTLEVLAPDVETVFNKLRNGVTLSFYDVDKYLQRTKEKSYYIGNGEAEQDFEPKIPLFSNKQIVDMLASKVRNNEVLSYKRGYTLNKVLGTIRKVVKESLAEKGINILYIVFGFLKWKESQDSDIWITSPLNLVPISIDNKGTNEPYYMSQYEDEISTNPTLIYRFKGDFGIELPCITDDDELRSHLEQVQKLVQSQGWQVVSDIAIGTFSFHKINMHNDLKENEDMILKNENVRRLLGREPMSTHDPTEEAYMEDYFEKSREIELHNVLDADSSQIEAIVQAKSGKNMVLQGPPGTGKSQTITNLIAEFLYDGKKILFVSEKLAALKVVSSNLGKAGLSEFCLELHSNRINKIEVIAELFRTLKLNKQNSNSERIEEEITSLLRSKRQLDMYAKVLHERQKVINRSPYEILGVISKYHSVEDFDFSISGIEKRNTDYLLDVCEVISDYKKLGEVFGNDFKKSCYFGYANPDASFPKATTIKKLIRNTRDFLEPMCELLQDLNDNYRLDLHDLQGIDRAISFLKAVGNTSFFDKAIFSKDKLETILMAVIDIVNLENDDAKLRKTIASSFDLSIFDLDTDNILWRFSHEYRSGFRFLKSSYRKDMMLLKSCLISKKHKLNYKTACEYLEMTGNCLKLNEKRKRKEEAVLEIIDKESFTDSWQSVADDLTRLRSVMSKDEPFFQEISRDEFLRIKADILRKTEVYDAFNENRQVITDLQKDYDKELLVLETSNINKLLYRMDQCLESFDELFNHWVKLVGTIERFKELDVYEFISASIDAQVQIMDLDQIFKKMFYKQWFLYLMANFPVLGSFGRTQQDKAVENFKEKDKLKFKISKSQIVSKISAMRPNLGVSSAGGQVNLLQREALKKRRQMPVRILLNSIPELVQTIKPCLMMSPLSVSTFLCADKVKFDVVIFDEASQIFPWDALGSIYRANQVIVVGDSKQMPPSNFFNAGVIDDGGEDDFEDDALDFESILDLCAASFDQRSLKWHYRSRVEELISFSNHNFYQNTLVSFPSSQCRRDDGVSFHFVPDGIFDRNAKNNIKEAEKVVELIYEHFQTQSDRSLGIVAFSQSQQATIENALQRRRKIDDRFSKFFDDNLGEPFFVKNLETIQGDERDTIIFSVGYARDIVGRFLHNFGPLNRKGGERRLNVAVTRAKFNVKLVASIKAYDIDLEKTRADGARLLKEYLDFAERGVISLSRTISIDDDATPDSDFEIEVHDVLESAGHKVKMQVGCSGYKIDLAIRHPEKDAYVLAIECDGATYHSGRSTRDRDRLRQEILERLGWTFYRIWSTDWFKNKATEKRRLLESVDKAIKAFDKQLDKDADFTQTRKLNGNKDGEDFADVVDQKDTQELRDFFTEYREANINALIKKYKKRYFEKKAFIEDVIRAEQPILEDLLLKKTAQVFGREKVTSVMRTEFDLVMRQSTVAKKISGYWTTDISAPISLRIPCAGVAGREIPMVCKEEIADGLLRIIQYNIGISKDGLFKTLINLMGFTRLGENITQRLEEALNLLLISRKIKGNEGSYILVE